MESIRVPDLRLKSHCGPWRQINTHTREARLGSLQKSRSQHNVGLVHRLNHSLGEWVNEWVRMDLDYCFVIARCPFKTDPGSHVSRRYVFIPERFSLTFSLRKYISQMQHLVFKDSNITQTLVTQWQIEHICAPYPNVVQQHTRFWPLLVSQQGNAPPYSVSCILVMKWLHCCFNQLLTIVSINQWIIQSNHLSKTQRGKSNLV